MKAHPYPQARKADLVVEELTSETVIYDTTSHRAHCLNKTASFIWQHCDGQTSVEELAKRLSECVGLPPDPEVVRLGLRELSDRCLLVSGSSGGNASSRRELTGRLALLGGTAAAAIPMVSSIVAPTPAMAKSNDQHAKKKK
jgi:hypothetical protein